MAQLVSDFGYVRAAERPMMVEREPATTGDPRWDALVAATVEHLCYHGGIDVPAWALAPQRFLDRMWFVSPYRSVHASAFVATPAAFANRGVFVHLDSLQSV